MSSTIASSPNKGAEKNEGSQGEGQGKGGRRVLLSTVKNVELIALSWHGMAILGAPIP